MKIVHALNFYGDNLGTQEVVRNLVRCELDAGYNPEIVTSDLSKNTANDICKVKRLPARLTISRIPFTPSLVRYILKKDADIFHLHGPLPWFDSVLSLKRLVHGNSKFIYRIQNLTFEHQLYSRFFGYGYQNIALRIAARAADVVITMTKTLAQLLSGIFNPQKTAIIRNGIDAGEYTVS
ncbi:MAG: glycosyltransferase family 4 protein, partial [Candidatus Hodarchaeota archaeon]